MQGLQCAEHHFHVVIRDDDILDAADFKTGARVHIYIVLLVLAQSAEGIELAVGDDILLTHARIDVHEFYRVVLVAPVIAFCRQVHLQCMSIVGDRKNCEILPAFGCGIQSHGFFRNINDTVLLVGEGIESLAAAYRRLHGVYRDGCKVRTVLERSILHFCYSCRKHHR